MSTPTTARSFARVVRLADLDNLYEAPAAPAVSEPFCAPLGNLPERAAENCSNDAMGDAVPRGRDARAAHRTRGPQPIGSTLPGALPEAESSRPAPLDSRLEARREYTRPVRDVPRLPAGEVLKLPIGFDGSGRGYARIWFGNVLLLLVTLGLAWPWTYRRSQRYVLHHTLVAGHRMAFRLSARALWPRLGMMMVLGLGVAGATVGSWRTGLAALTLGCLMWPLMSYLGLDQRVGSVAWAGRRLWFDGPWHGVYRAALTPLVLGVAGVWCCALGLHRNDGALLGAAAVLGLAWAAICPLSVWQFLHYRQHHLRLGPLRLRWKASRADIASVLVRVVGWAALVFLAAAVAIGALALAWSRWRGGLPGGVGYGLCALAAGLGLSAALPFAQASLIKRIWNKTGNRHLRVRSRLSAPAYVRLYMGNALKVVCTLGLYWPWAYIALRRERTRSLTLWSRVDPEVLLAYWSRRQSEAPPTVMSAPPVQASAEQQASDTQPSVARTGTFG